MSSNNSADSPSGSPVMGSNSPALQQIFISIIVLSSVFIAICLVRWFLLQTTTRRTSLPEKHNTGGLDSVTIAALPTFPYKKYSDTNNNGSKENNGSTMECSICLSVVEEGEMVKLLPACMHSFHGNCIGLWLSGHKTCPVCRIEVLGSASVVQYQPNQVELVVVPVLDLERRP